MGGKTPGMLQAGGYGCSSAGAGAMRGSGGSVSSTTFKLQFKASLSLGNLAWKPMESLAWKKYVGATPYVSGNVSSPKANAEVFFFMHLGDGHFFSHRKLRSPVSLWVLWLGERLAMALPEDTPGTGLHGQGWRLPVSLLVLNFYNHVIKAIKRRLLTCSALQQD